MQLGKGLVLGARFGTFTFFIILNAVICTVSVYNLALANDAGLHPNVDGYLIFVSALALVSIIPLIFIDMYVKDPYVCRLWVECVWVAVFWIMELIGAVAFSAIVPAQLCYAEVPISGAACQSTKAIEACTWLCMIILFDYLALLAYCGFRHERIAPNVWQTSVRYFPWFDDNPRVEYPDPAPPYRQRPTSEPVMPSRPLTMPAMTDNQRPRNVMPRIRLTIPTTVRDVMGRIGRTSPEPNLVEPQSAITDAPMAGPSLIAPPAVPPSRASRRSFLSFTRSRRSSRRPSARRPYDPESFYPDHLQAALNAIVYDGPTEPSTNPGHATHHPSKPLPQAVLIAGPASWQDPRPPVPPLPSLGRSGSSRPLPSPMALATPPLAHIAPSRPQLTIDTSTSALHPAPAPGPTFASSRRGPRPPPQMIARTAPAPAPAQVITGSSRVPIPPPPALSPTLTPPRTVGDPTPTSASISPLGDWPSTNMHSLPLRPRKRAPPPPPSSFPLVEDNSTSSHVPLLSTAGVRRDSGGSEPTPTSSISTTAGQGQAVGPSPRGSLSSRLVQPPRGPRTRQESLSSLNSVQLSNMVTNAWQERTG